MRVQCQTDCKFHCAFWNLGRNLYQRYLSLCLVTTTILPLAKSLLCLQHLEIPEEKHWIKRCTAMWYSHCSSACHSRIPSGNTRTPFLWFIATSLICATSNWWCVSVFLWRGGGLMLYRDSEKIPIWTLLRTHTQILLCSQSYVCENGYECKSPSMTLPWCIFIYLFLFKTFPWPRWPRVAQSHHISETKQYWPE